MALLFQNDADSLLLQNGVDDLLLQAPDPIVIFTHDEGMLRAASSAADFLGSHSQAVFDHSDGMLDGSAANLQGAHTFGTFTHDDGGISLDGNFVGSATATIFAHDEGLPGSSATEFLGVNDFTELMTGRELLTYVCDLDTPGGTVRVPMSSWQATLQVDRSNYVQCVIPAAADFASDINAATGFTISLSTTVAGVPIEYEIATMASPTVRTDRSPRKYTATLSGYSTGFAEDLNPPTVYDRTLAGIRSISTSSAGYRVRCTLDFLLRPSHRVYLDETENFIVSYINFYSTNQGSNKFDSYMDVGERL